MNVDIQKNYQASIDGSGMKNLKSGDNFFFTGCTAKPSAKLPQSKANFR